MRGPQLNPIHRAGPTHPPRLRPDKSFRPKDNFRVLRSYDARDRQSYQNVSRETFWYDLTAKPDKPRKTLPQGRGGSSKMDRPIIHLERGFCPDATFIRRLDGEARSTTAGCRRRRIDDFEHPAHHIVDKIDL